MKILRKALSKPGLWLLVSFFVVGILPRCTSFFESSKQASLFPASTLLNILPDSGNSVLDKLRHENIHLKTELIQQKKMLAEYKQLISQVKLLTSTIADDVLYEIIPAKVLMGFDLSEWRYSIAVNKGASHKVKIGYPVTVGNVLVGRVIAVGISTCRVQLIVDPGFPGVKTVIEKQGFSSANAGTSTISHGMLKGSARKAYMLSLLHIPHTDAVVKGDKAFVSNQSFMFPGGLFIGSIENVRREGDPKFYRIDVKPAINPKSIENVQILTYKHKDLIPPTSIAESVHAE
ncbi:MAG: rod shape-determining protein MreC [Planctomycetes bacterium]|nr:rod shape-determining protein MreC [Planctomycetota bacterium]